MNTSKKNTIISLLKARAEFHKSTFGEAISWNSKKNTNGKWSIDVYEKSISASHYFDEVAKIADAAMVSAWLDTCLPNGEKGYRIHLF